MFDTLLHIEKNIVLKLYCLAKSKYDIETTINNNLNKVTQFIEKPNLSESKGGAVSDHSFA